MLRVTQSAYWKNVNPAGAVSDLVEVFRQAGSARWRIAAAAMATTFVLFWMITHDSWRMPPPRPKVIYINSWPKDRTAAQTRKFIEANQKWKDERAAEEAAAAEETRKMYKALGRMSGMDVDKIERDAKAEASAEASTPAADAAQQPQQTPVAKQ